LEAAHFQFLADAFSKGYDLFLETFLQL